MGAGLVLGAIGTARGGGGVGVAPRCGSVTSELCACAHGIAAASTANAEPHNMLAERIAATLAPKTVALVRIVVGASASAGTVIVRPPPVAAVLATGAPAPAVPHWAPPLAHGKNAVKQCDRCQRLLVAAGGCPSPVVRGMFGAKTKPIGET
ncbi:hypothetical protein GCM10009106_13940 [Sphingomonas japonica]